MQIGGSSTSEQHHCRHGCGVCDSGVLLSHRAATNGIECIECAITMETHCFIFTSKGLPRKAGSHCGLIPGEIRLNEEQGPCEASSLSLSRFLSLPFKSVSCDGQFLSRPVTHWVWCLRPFCSWHSGQRISVVYQLMSTLVLAGPLQAPST